MATGSKMLFCKKVLAFTQVKEIQMFIAPTPRAVHELKTFEERMTCVGRAWINAEGQVSMHQVGSANHITKNMLASRRSDFELIVFGPATKEKDTDMDIDIDEHKNIDVDVDVDMDVDRETEKDKDINTDSDMAIGIDTDIDFDIDADIYRDIEIIG